MLSQMELHFFQMSERVDLYILRPLTLDTPIDIAPPCYVTHLTLQGFSLSHNNQEELFLLCFIQHNFLLFSFSFCRLTLTHQKKTTAGDGLL